MKNEIIKGEKIDLNIQTEDGYFGGVIEINENKNFDVLGYDAWYSVLGFEGWYSLYGYQRFYAEIDSIGKVLKVDNFFPVKNVVSSKKIEDDYLLLTREYSKTNGKTVLNIVKLNKSKEKTIIKEFDFIGNVSGFFRFIGNDIIFVIRLSNKNTRLIRIEGEKPQDISIASKNEFISKSNFTITNFPNPFISITNLKYNIPKKTKVKISLYDISGKLVKRISNKIKNSGNYSYKLDLNGLKTGIYFLKMSALNQTIIKKCVYNK